MIWYFTAPTSNCVCTLDSQCLEYLGCLTLNAAWTLLNLLISFREWNKELEYKTKALKSGSTYNPSLFKAIIRAFGFKFALLGIWALWEECVLRILQPLFMSWFIRYFSSEDSGISTSEAYAYGLGIVGMSALYTLTHHQYWFGVMHTGMKLRVAHCSFIYRKVSKSK